MLARPCERSSPGRSGFVGPHLIAHLRASRRRGRRRSRRGHRRHLRSRRRDARGSKASTPRSCTTSPVGATSAARGPSPSRCSGSTPRAPCTCSGRRRGRRPAGARGLERRRLRHRRRRPTCRSPRSTRCARSARTRRARWRPTTSGCRPGSATAWRSCGSAAFNHLGPGQTTAFVAPAIASRIAGQRARRWRRGPRRQPRRPARPHRRPRRRAGLPAPRRARPVRARPTTCAPASTSRVAELADRLLAWPRTRCGWSSTPSRHRPVDVPVLRGDPTKLPGGDRLGARDPARARPSPTSSTTGAPGRAWSRRLPSSVVWSSQRSGRRRWRAAS